MEDVFFGTRTVAETVYRADSAEVTCRIEERWKTVHVMTSACGGSTEYAVTKRTGLTQTDAETLSASFSSTIGIPKLAELKSTVETKLASEVKWEIGSETQHKHIVQAPLCGRRTDTIYQKFRDHHFLAVRRGWFGRIHSRAWGVSEAISHYHVQPEIDIWIPECQCPKKIDPPTFEIVPAALEIGSVRLGLEMWSSPSGVRLNFAGRLAPLEFRPEQPVKLDLPRAIVPPLVLWLAERTEDPVEAVLIPNYELMVQQGDRARLGLESSLQTLAVGAGGSEEEDNEA